ncbi:MAG: nuclear transport factor 2 family protein [Mucilaginibacter sp.]
MENKDILIKANACVSDGDNEGFLAYCTDDVKWEFVGDQILSGKEAVRDYMIKNYTEPPKFNLENLIPGGDYVTAIGKINLKQAAGKSTDYAYCDVWRFHDCLMAELKAFVIEIKS